MLDCKDDECTDSPLSEKVLFVIPLNVTFCLLEKQRNFVHAEPATNEYE